MKKHGGEREHGTHKAGDRHDEGTLLHKGEDTFFLNARGTNRQTDTQY
jgi:hypothetical protein